MAMIPEPRLTEKERKLFERGIRLFNQQEFFEAHEVWEEIWKEFPEPWRLFFQGLIQAAAAFVQVQKNKPEGMILNLDKALGKLKSFPAVCFGIENKKMIQDFEALRLQVSNENGFPSQLVMPSLEYHQPTSSSFN